MSDQQLISFRNLVGKQISVLMPIEKVDKRSLNHYIEVAGELERLTSVAYAVLEEKINGGIKVSLLIPEMKVLANIYRRHSWGCFFFEQNITQYVTILSIESDVISEFSLEPIRWHLNVKTKNGDCYQLRNCDLRI